MPSSLNLFIRVPNGYNATDIFDAVIRKDICKVIDVVIKKGKSHNNAIVMIDYWYKGTRQFRDTLLRGESIAIPFANGMLCAYEYNPNRKAVSSVSVKKTSSVRDEFGRDIPKTAQLASKRVRGVVVNDVPSQTNTRSRIPIAPALTTALNVNAPVFVPMVPAIGDILPPYVTDNRAERARNYTANNDAALDFIQEYEATFATPGETQVRQFTAFEILANVRDDIDMSSQEDEPANFIDEPGFIPDDKYFEVMRKTPLVKKQADAIAPGAPDKNVKATDCSLAEIIRNLDTYYHQPEADADADAVSEITEPDLEEEPPRKPRHVEMDLDEPKEPSVDLKYNTFVKKRNIKFTIPKSKYT